MLMTPAFSPGPCRTQGAVVGSVLSSLRECLYEQCSLQSALTIPSSVKVGVRPSIFTSRSYSSCVSPCSATSAAVIAGSPGRGTAVTSALVLTLRPMSGLLDRLWGRVGLRCLGRIVLLGCRGLLHLEPRRASLGYRLHNVLGSLCRHPHRVGARRVRGRRGRLRRGRWRHRWMLARDVGRDGGWRGALPAITSRVRAKDRVHDLVAVEHDEVSHADSLLLSVPVKQVCRSPGALFPARRPELHDGLSLAHPRIDHRLRVERRRGRQEKSCERGT